MPRKSSKKSVNHLRAWREFRRLTQDELATRVGTAGNVIGLLESGERRLSDKWLRVLAPALNTRPGFLLEFDPQDVELEILEAAVSLHADQKPQAVRVLRAMKTGTEG